MIIAYQLDPWAIDIDKVQTHEFNGTSAAAPVATGVIAQILSANPLLTWRDVKYILANTSEKVEKLCMSEKNAV